MTSSSVYTIKKGNSPWSVARDTLKAQGKKADNAAIAAEMNRLAKLNGCDNVNDFANKYFNSLGNEILLSKEIPAKQKNKNKTGNAEIDRINALSTDTERIIEYNKKHYFGQYYGIVDKKQCKLFIYDKSGKVVDSYVVGVGKLKGDNLQSYYMERAEKTPLAYKAETGRYTTAGEFTLDEVTSTSDSYIGKDGKPKIMHLKGDNRGERGGQMALHMLYKPAYQTREYAINTPNLVDNRMSYGCVNLKEEDYDSMYKYLGEGDKLFVLPEEQGNSLLLEKQKDGSFRFAQQYHKNDTRGVPADVASKVNYDVKPERASRTLMEILLSTVEKTCPYVAKFIS